MARSDWPELPFAAWKDTCQTLHRWTQMVGKTLLATTPLVNHWWNTALRVGARGLCTGPMPLGTESIEVEFDFVDHRLVARRSDGRTESLLLEPKSVARFYRDYLDLLAGLGARPAMTDIPCEIATEAIPFTRDTLHRSYDRGAVERWFAILRRSAAVFERFRAPYLGKCSPVHFFWGSFDLAYTRFSGRRAPPRPGANAIEQEGYSHELVSFGFWPGMTRLGGPAYYAYAVPAPPGFESRRLRPEPAHWDEKLGEFLLLYDDVRASGDPEAAILDFLQSAWEAAAELGNWNRESLERSGGLAPRFEELPAP